MSGARATATVEFMLVSALVLFLFLLVLQVGFLLHTRTVLVAAAQEGARYGANADRGPADAERRALRGGQRRAVAGGRRAHGPAARGARRARRRAGHGGDARRAGAAGAAAGRAGAAAGAGARAGGGVRRPTGDDGNALVEFILPGRAAHGAARVRPAQRLRGAAGVVRRDGGRAAGRPGVRHGRRPGAGPRARGGRGVARHARPGARLRRLPHRPDRRARRPTPQVTATVEHVVRLPLLGSVLGGGRAAASRSTPRTSRSSTASGRRREARAATRAASCCSSSASPGSCSCWSPWSRTCPPSCSPSAASRAPPTARRCPRRRRSTSTPSTTRGSGAQLPLDAGDARDRVAAYEAQARAQQPGLRLVAAARGAHGRRHRLADGPAAVPAARHRRRSGCPPSPAHGRPSCPEPATSLARSCPPTAVPTSPPSTPR